MTQTQEQLKDTVLDAALDHVAFDGWSEATLKAAVDQSGVEASLARQAFPRGAVDLAMAYHARGDALMLKAVRMADLSGLRFRDRIARAVQLRIEAIDNKEAVRRGSTLFALPQYAPDGAKAIWGTADAIWDVLGDTSDDINWYTKRATLSGVYGATVLYWLGDDSVDAQATWTFLDRRIDNVMQIEKVKAQVRDNPVLSKLFAGPNWLASQIKAPTKMPNMDMPGSWNLSPEPTDPA